MPPFAFPTILPVKGIHPHMYAPMHIYVFMGKKSLE